MYLQSIFEDDPNVKIKVVLVPEKEATVYYNAEITYIDEIREKIDDVGFERKLQHNSETYKSTSLGIQYFTEFYTENRS